MRFKITLSTIMVILLFSCKKQGTPIYSLAALNVINAAPDVPSLNANFTTSPIPYYQYQNPIYFGSSYEFSQTPGDIPIILFSSADTLTAFYENTVSLKERGIYSLYVLSGATKGDVLFMEDSIPTREDNTAGVRFINASEDSPPITINLQGNNPDHTEFGPLSYKQISAFKSCDASVQYGSYTFDVRDKSTGNLLTAFTWNYANRKNNTLVICGSVNPVSSTPITVFQVNNY